MDSDDEIFLTQNTFSQEPFSLELNLEELVGDFREVSERDSVVVEKKENPGRNIVVVCDNEVEKRRESRIPANTKVNTSWAVRRCWEEWAVERNVKVKKNSSKEKYYEVNPDRKSLMSSFTSGLGSLFWKFGRRKILEACILLIPCTRCVVVYSGS